MRHIGRKLYHLFGGLGLLSLYYLLERNRALAVYALLFLAVLGLDVFRLAIPSVNRFIFSRFRSFIRTNEEHRITGTAPYILGIGLSLYFYSTEVATAAVCFLAFGDVAATTIGEQYGKTRIGNKSLEGTAAFIAAALGAGLLLSFLGILVMPWVLVLGALAAAAVELFLHARVNDNLMIPIISGAVMEMALRSVR